MMKYYITYFLLLMSFLGFSQTKNIRGVVTEANTKEPLVGVNVLVKGTTKGAMTDFSGMFELQNVTSKTVLEISYLGYVSQTITVGNQNEINVSLSEDVAQLEGVVLIGYGTQKKKEITGAVSVVETETIEKLNPVRVEQALQGQVSGVAITSSSGSPGAASNIRIRGISTNGDNAPLILVDGNPITDLSVINPNDIKSVNVLKDATAGIYGVRAANGVILIETKSGSKESPLKFNLDTYYAFQQTSKKLDLLNPAQFAAYVNKANGSLTYFEQPVTGQIYDVAKSAVTPMGTTDWQDQVFETSPMYNINLSASGGTKKLAYAFGGSYLTQDGIVGGAESNYERMTARTKLQYDVTDQLSLSATAIYTYSEKNNLAENGVGSVLYNAINADPLTGVYDSTPLQDAGFEKYRNGFGIVNTNAIEVANPVSQIASTYNTNVVKKISPTFTAEYKFLDHFSVRSKYQFNHATDESTVFRPLTFLGVGKSLTRTTRNELVDNVDTYDDYTWNNLITYTNTFKEVHSLNVLLGQEVRENRGEYSGLFGEILREGSNSFSDANISNFEEVRDRFTEAEYTIGSNQFKERLSSYFTRVQYNYKEKYLFSGMFRRDTSSKFGPENKVGYFPSFSLGWVMSDEPFLENTDWLSNLKLRLSYGKIGNDRIDDFAYISRLDGEGVYSNNQENNVEDLLTGVAIGKLANPEIKWETSTTSNLGVDFSIFRNKINITADVYSKKTEDLLIAAQISGLTGVGGIGSSAPVINAGTVENKGFEMMISYRDQFSDDFKFNTSFNFSTIHNEVLYVGSESGFIEGGAFGLGTGILPSRMEKGHAIGYFYGYKTEGIYQNQSEIDALDAASPEGTYHSGAGVGDLKFSDTNGDGQITEADRTDIGDPIPNLTAGWNVGFSYKNIDFSASAFGSFGNDMVRDYERVNTLANKNVRVLDAWTASNPSTTTPRVVSGASINTDYFSDYYVEDASYIRIQNVQVGYTFQKEALSKYGIDKLRFYASANNLHTFTDYDGFDPSASSSDPIGAGIDRGFYPVAKTYIFGMNLSF
ncbi:SusC/RagA family TonB-linked outer membrane protein [Ochrovirga pacifica]|uniref:SusC/RagA family TonB-linked outer membrane protein n=1 Tax=Ochrovirga pacifica TaxID=1042376 RepID=UPI00049781C6|nr:TonB-dependent receptor [Ochrovirga pacifica]